MNSRNPSWQLFTRLVMIFLINSIRLSFSVRAGKSFTDPNLSRKATSKRWALFAHQALTSQISSRLSLSPRRGLFDLALNILYHFDLKNSRQGIKQVLFTSLCWKKSQTFRDQNSLRKQRTSRPQFPPRSHVVCLYFPVDPVLILCPYIARPLHARRGTVVPSFDISLLTKCV